MDHTWWILANDYHDFFMYSVWEDGCNGSKKPEKPRRYPMQTMFKYCVSKQFIATLFSVSKGWNWYSLSKGSGLHKQSNVGKYNFSFLEPFCWPRLIPKWPIDFLRWSYITYLILMFKINTLHESILSGGCLYVDENIYYLCNWAPTWH